MKQVNSLIEKFCEKNRKFWNDNNSNEFCLIDGFPLWPTSVNECARVGKIIEKKYNLKSLVIFNKKEPKELLCRKLYESYCINKFCYINQYLFDKRIFLKSIIFSIFFILSHLFSKMLNWKLGVVRVGEIIYDTCLTQKINPKSIKSLRVIFITLLYYLSYKKLLVDYSIRYAVFADKEYSAQGVLFQLCIERNIPVILSGTTRAKRYSSNNFLQAFMHPDISIDEIKFKNKASIDKICQHLENRMSGNVAQHDVKNTYINKHIYNRKELFDKLAINSNKPVAFVFPHVFSDCPHNTEYLLFDDYKQWFISVLKEAKKNKNVIFIVKPHPSAYMYGEQDAVIKNLRRYKSDNIYLCPKDFHNKSLIDCCDIIVTCQGTIALEMACYGIPNILAGAGYYNGYGFTKEFLNAKEYINFIKTYSKDSVCKLDSDSIENALNVYYYIYETEIIDKIFPPSIMHINDLADEYAYEKVFCDNLQILIQNLDNPKNKDFCLKIDEIC